MLTKEIKDMSVESRLELASEIWESIRIDEEWDESIPLWQRKILEERLKYSLQHPDEGTPSEEVMEKLRSKYNG